jgi:putative addiction module CopG family antidote
MAKIANLCARENPMSTMNISLTPQLEKLVQDRVKSGRYTSASEVVREALRLLETHDRAVEELVHMRAEVSTGLQQLDNGQSSPFDQAAVERIKRRGRERQGALPSFIAERAASIKSLCERYGVRELAIFGSSIRRDFDPASSDVDLAVVFGPPPNDSLADQYFDFKEKFEELMGRPVDLVDIEAMPETRLKRIIERSKVPIYAAG